ncbi:glycoside hydrolase family 3 protein [Lentzea sp. HUAS TT2]|uniref:glycoside hydrolase family 3 protein n=1 Tax=Lentzea sp. HUAS TT2 TaxID=3447454 RepID=UPI003F70A5B4
MINPDDARVEALLRRMTIEEKAGQLFHGMAGVGPGGRVLADDDPAAMGPLRAQIAAGISHVTVMGPATPADMARWHDAVQDLAARTRLGIPVTLSLGLGAVRDPDLVRAYAATVRHELAAAGISVLLGPTLDVASEPRWARTIETFGADPELVTALAAAFLDGFTADADVPPVAAMIKHFPGGGPQKDGEDPHFDYGKEQVYPGGAFDLHLRPFADVLARYPVQVMPYYGVPTGPSLDGGPVDEVGFAFNRRIITGLLRETLGFSGLVCTDFALVTDRTVFRAPMRARAWGVEHLDGHERVVQILDAGCDQLGGEVAPELVVDLVRDGRLTEERLDASVHNAVPSWSWRTETPCCRCAKVAGCTPRAWIRRCWPGTPMSWTTPSAPMWRCCASTHPTSPAARGSRGSSTPEASASATTSGSTSRHLPAACRSSSTSCWTAPRCSGRSPVRSPR